MNIYATFLHKGIDLIAPKGYLGFITPNSFLTQSSYEKLRDLILKNAPPIAVARMPDKVFKGVTAESVVTILSRIPDNKCSVIIYDPNTQIKHISLENAKSAGTIDPRMWVKMKGNVFNIFINNTQFKLLEKISKTDIHLSKVCEFSLGITPYDKYRGHTTNEIKSKVYHASDKRDDTYKPLLAGADILRYSVQWNKKTWLSYGEWLGAPREQRFFTQPRILIRQIISGSPLRIYAGYTEEELYNTQVAFNLLLRDNIDCSLKYILAILNSTLMTFYHRYRFLDLSKYTFQKILIQDAKNFPIFLPDFNNNNDKVSYHRVVTLVDQMLALNKKLSDAIMESERMALQDKISQIDLEIDQLVYELYGLTDEEVGIVVESMNG